MDREERPEHHLLFRTTEIDINGVKINIYIDNDRCSVHIKGEIYVEDSNPYNLALEEESKELSKKYNIPDGLIQEITEYLSDF